MFVSTSVRGVKMSVSPSYLELLQAKEQELLGKLSGLEDLKIVAEPDALDEVMNSSQRDLASSVHEHDTNTLKEVRLAIRRIADQTYGECMNCEEDIAPKRLRAIPWATYCLRCQNLKEKHAAKQKSEMFKEGDDLKVAGEAA